MRNRRRRTSCYHRSYALLHMLAHIFLLCKTREIVPVSPTVVTNRDVGGRAARAGGRRYLRSRPPAYASETRLYLHSVRFSPPRTPSASTIRSTVRSVRATGRYGTVLCLAARPHKFLPLVACATRGRRAHMVAHTSKKGLLAHRIDGLEPNMELSSGLIFGDWDDILQGGCRYQGG